MGVLMPLVMFGMMFLVYSFLAQKQDQAVGSGHDASFVLIFLSFPLGYGLAYALIGNLLMVGRTKKMRQELKRVS